MNKLVIVGCGWLAEIVADAVINGLLPEYELFEKPLFPIQTNRQDYVHAVANMGYLLALIYLFYSCTYNNQT